MRIDWWLHETERCAHTQRALSAILNPIPDREHRTPRIPDADRIWLTFGVGYRPTTRLRVDLSYGHIFSPRVSTRNQDPVTGATLVGNFRTFGDIFAFQVTYDIDWTFSDLWGEPM